MATVLALLFLAMAAGLAGTPQSACAGSQADLWLNSEDPPTSCTAAQPA